ASAVSCPCLTAGAGQAWGHDCSPEAARVGMVGWEAVLDPGAGGRPDGTAHVHGGVRLSWVPGSHGLLSSAGLASNAGLAVSPGCPAAVLVVLFCRGCCQRRRLGVAR